MIVTLKVSVTGLGDRLKRLREKKGCSQKGLAKRLKCSESYVSKIENESLSADLPVEKLLSVVKAMGYPVPKSPKITSKQEIIAFLDSLDP